MEATKKLAPPGRRTSAKREAFKVENDVTTTGNVTVPTTSSTQATPDTDREAAAKNQQRIENERNQQRALEEERRQREAMEQVARAEAEEVRRQEARKQEEIIARDRAMHAREQAEISARQAAMAAAEESGRQLASQQPNDDDIKARDRARNAELQRLERARAEQDRVEEQEARRQREEEQRQRRAMEEREILQQRKREQIALEQEAETERLNLAAMEAKTAAVREAQEAEERQLELERLRREATERARLEQQQQQQTAAASDLEAKRKAEEQRKKRAAFLSGMDSFAVSFEQQAAESEAALRQAQQEEQRLARDIASLPTVPIGADPVDKKKKKEYTIAAEEIALPQPAAIAAVEKKEVRAVPAPSLSNDATKSSGGINSSLTQSLFGSSSATTDSIVVDTTASGSAVDSSITGPVGELRVPTKFASARFNKQPSSQQQTAAPKEETKNDLFESLSESTAALALGAPVAINRPPVAPAAAAVAPVRDPQQQQAEDEDGDEEYDESDELSTIFTREERRTLTAAQRATWRARQQDLTTLRRDLHGAATYAFDGIFVWQMYGSAEALDEFGNTYTEYLMRCQWGTSFDNLQPWIVAHRYKEFDKLDADLKRLFPALEANMPKLPKKELFRYMESSVVAKRRADLEEYMSRIVTSLPAILRSEAMDAFLTIGERIRAIKHLLSLQSTSMAPVTQQQQQQPVAIVYGVLVPAPAPAPSSSQQLQEQQSQPTAAAAVPQEVVEEESFDMLWSVDDADEARTRIGCRALDEDSLGQLEEDIRQIGLMLRNHNAGKKASNNSSYNKAELTKLIHSVNRRWPTLRATAIVDMMADFVLIPRAMQAEEDYVHYLNEFRSMKALALT